eukprot:TRINITY_DN22181_c0_g1_i1.p1 TRINITY_DN22181_c0_g1~~TRINITY_DN22181_c0_g1_i1.p1  ORF type:complete len:675 (+),score=390.92 TRINITY_DN22181_c0_g1_i1:48-2027(+)
MSGKVKSKAAAVGDTSGGEHLANASVNLISLRQHARLELTRLLDSVRGRKALVLDRSLSGQLGLVAEVSLLKAFGVAQIHYLLEQPLATDCEAVVYLVRPETRLMHLIADQVQGHIRAGDTGKKYGVFFVSRRTMLCERVLSDRGVYGELLLGEYQLDLIPMEEDLLSLELPGVFRECFLDGDPTALFSVARSLVKLQTLFGLIPHVSGVGENAKRVYALMDRMRRESPGDQYNVVPEIDSLILIDRSVDLVTPMLTQLTYEGLLDEVVGINNSYIDVEEQVLTGKPPTNSSSSSSEPAKRKHLLNGKDSLYKEVRDLPFRSLGAILHRKAGEIQETYNKKDDAQTVSQLKEYMKQFKTAHTDHKELQTHINLAEHVNHRTLKDMRFVYQLDVEHCLVAGNKAVTMSVDECVSYVDGLIGKMEPMTKALRLLTLLSMTAGLDRKQFDAFRRKVVQAYGFERAMQTLANLEAVGMLRASRSSWDKVRHSLRLWTEDAQESKSQDDICFTHQGYAPLSVRLIEVSSAAKEGWRALDDVLRLLNAEHFTHQQELPVSIQERAKIMGQSSSASTSSSAGTSSVTDQHQQHQQQQQGRKKLTLVYFLGGVTFAEISALRFLSERESSDRRYIVATTKIINGASLLDDLIEFLPNELDRSSLKEL